VEQATKEDLSLTTASEGSLEVPALMALRRIQAAQVAAKPDEQLSVAWFTFEWKVERDLTSTDFEAAEEEASQLTDEIGNQLAMASFVDREVDKDESDLFDRFHDAWHGGFTVVDR
jgi:hypothetical protein